MRIFCANASSRFVFAHLPQWPVSQGGESEILGDFALEQILLYHRVDAYLSGHHHAFYPGVHNSMLYVSQACVGAGPRPLIGEEKPSVRALTVMTINRTGHLEIQALSGPDFLQPLDFSTLPRAIRHLDIELVRFDLAGGRSK